MEKSPYFPPSFPPSGELVIPAGCTFHFPRFPPTPQRGEGERALQKYNSIFEGLANYYIKCDSLYSLKRFQRLIDTWHRTSERLKQEVIDNFEATDILNPVYMMAFSGARGNISQVRQLVGMRGLMSNPQGQIIDFPIRSNFREGLTLTEYIISSYGARKGIVDTALRTANAGYLTRRLVDVAQHVIISKFDCGSKRGIFLTDMKEGNKTIYSLQNRLVGRVLARDIFKSLPSNTSIQGVQSLQKIKVASRNLEISSELATSLASICKKVFVRSSLTCQTKNLVCQLCYGWSLAQGNLVAIGEAVGVVAAQSIGEPGTQLTMRTFHTGGVFSGDVSDQIKAPFNGIVIYDTPIAGTLIRTPEGKIAFLTKNEGSFSVILPSRKNNESKIIGQLKTNNIKKFKIPFYTLLFFKNGEEVLEKEVIAQISSINRSKNATDQAEFTINAELSGQFFSKFLNLKENKVGPKLKSLTALKQTVEGSNDEKPSVQIGETKFKKSISGSKSSTGSPEIFVEQFNENVVETIYEAWGWGYAWILSGKIYQLPVASTFFPILGDFLNNKSYMNKNIFTVPCTFGNLFKLSTPFNTKIFNKTLIKKMRQSSNISSKQVMSLSSPSKRPFISSQTNASGLIINNNQTKVLEEQAAYIKKDLTILKKELISLQLSKIVYKKIGYLLRLTKPENSNSTNQASRCVDGFANSNLISNLKPGLSSVSQTSTSKFLNRTVNLLSHDDSLILLSSLNGYLNSTENLILNSNIKKLGRDKNINKFSYPINWISFFDVFLNWFPKRLYTKTGGLIMLEPILLNNFGDDFTWSDSTMHEHSFKTVANLSETTSKTGLFSLNSGHFFKPYNNSTFLVNLKKASSDFIFLNISDTQKFNSNYNLQRYIDLKKIKNIFSLSNFINENDTMVLNTALSNPSFLYAPMHERSSLEGEEINNYYLKNQSENEISLTNKINPYQSQAIKFYPTFVKRWILKKKIKDLISFQRDNRSASKQASNTNEWQDSNFKSKNTLIGKGNVTNLNSIGASDQYSNNLIKNFIIDQFQTNELNSVIFQKQLHGLNKNKTKSELLTYGLNWKNNFKLNFNELNTQSTGDLIMQKNYLNSITPLNQKLKGYQKNEDIDLQRILFIPHSFYHFSNEKSLISNKNFRSNFKNIAQDIKDGTSAYIPTINSKPLKNYFTNFIIQNNRQGKIQKFYLKEGFFNKYNSFNKINQNGFFIKKNLNKESSGNQRSNQPFPCSSTKDFSSVNNDLNTILFLGNKFKFKELFNQQDDNGTNIHTSSYQKVLNSFNSFDTSELKKLKKILLDQLKFIELKTERKVLKRYTSQKIDSKDQIDSPISLKTFSKLASFPYFLNKKSSVFINRETSQNSLRNKSDDSDLSKIIPLSKFGSDSLIKPIQTSKKNIKIGTKERLKLNSKSTDSISDSMIKVNINKKSL